MAKKLVLATRNQHKKEELAVLLEGCGAQILTLDELPSLPEVVEDGLTFRDNAVKKARSTALASGFYCLADDSGLVVDILGGQPGVYSARFAGPQADDQNNNQKLLSLLSSVPLKEREARFVCVIAISDPQGETRTVEGSCPGSIAFEPHGQGGFGYDPLFIPDGFSCTFAELNGSEKNRISHRGRALLEAIPIILEIMNDS
ncbi:MAG TPA: XTP/dITP diphosphatase [Syntrophomonadaceae bacterium]|nr:XTP/dITP diphosphatase [Syntrophomonadaceae bacterium]